MVLKPAVSDENFETMVTTLSEYLQFSLSIIEQRLDDGEIQDVIDGLAQLISMGNTIGYFRGESSVLTIEPDILPESKIRSKAAKFESDFENRVHAIISKIMESDYVNDYIMTLFQYFVVARSVGYGNESKLVPPVA